MQTLYNCIRGNLKECTDVEEALSELKRIYTTNVAILKDCLEKDVSPDPYPNYPFVGLRVRSENLHHDSSLSYGAVQEPGYYGTTLTHIDFFEDYLREQLHALSTHHQTTFVIGESYAPIPLSYAIRDMTPDIDDDGVVLKFQKFIMPDLTRINDDVPNGMISKSSPIRPLALFNAERIDFSIHRLEHYTGTAIEHFQQFIIFINYQRYVDAFLQYGLEQLKGDAGYTAFVGPNGQTIDAKYAAEPPKILAQMPAFHLKRKNRLGITFINIGVGPSNAKNITDHLAVLRPHCWLMLGHCAGLRHNLLLGDYVLAHAYVREDHVLDNDLPAWIPIPPLADIQRALEKAVLHMCAQDGTNIKKCLRTGTIVTTGDRNWELKSRAIYERFKQTRAIAVDMESATVAANGFRFRVPYGTLLCVSDKPIHGEVKLKGMADEFYRKRVRQHLEIGLKTIELLHENGAQKLHSRKLRGFDEPAFR